MFEELEAYEDELNFDDEEVTDKELELVESKAMANLTRAVDYLDGKTLYEFFAALQEVCTSAPLSYGIAKCQKLFISFEITSSFSCKSPT